MNSVARRLPDLFGRRRIFDLECALEEALGRIEELEANCEVVSVDFEKECWRAMRRLLDRCAFDWRNVDSDGVTADHAEEFIAEHLKGVTIRAEAAERLLAGRTAALEKIAGRHVTIAPLWWQLEARAALKDTQPLSGEKV